MADEQLGNKQKADLVTALGWYRDSSANPAYGFIEDVMQGVRRNPNHYNELIKAEHDYAIALIDLASYTNQKIVQDEKKGAESRVIAAREALADVYANAVILNKRQPGQAISPESFKKTLQIYKGLVEGAFTKFLAVSLQKHGLITADVKPDSLIIEPLTKHERGQAWVR